MKNFIAFILLCFAPGAYSQTPVWTQKADYGGGEIYDPFSFTINEKGYVGTGKSLPGGIMHSDFWEYDPITNVWTQKANFPGTGRYGAKGFSIGSFGYAGTGWDPNQKKDFYKYNPAANVWTAIADFGGTARYTSTAFSIGNYGFLGLGFSGCKKDFWRYDPVVNSWNQVADYPGQARQAATVFVINDTGYVGLGICPGSGYSDFYKYDYLNNIWQSTTSFPDTPRSSVLSFVINGIGYLGCGNNYLSNNQSFTNFQDFWMFDPIAAQWTQLPDFPGGKLFCGIGFELNNRGYFGMGSDTNNFTTSFSDVFWEYYPDSVTSVNELNDLCKECKLFPNPTNGTVYVQLFENKGNYNYSIFNIKGQLVREGNMNPVSNRIQISADNLSSGLYLLQVSQNGKKVFVEKFIRE